MHNVETFGNALMTSFQFLTSESWSAVMYWYMEHSIYFPKYGTALFFVIQFVWLRCILFSLFIAVLLVNFSVEETQKMPRQVIKYEREQAAKEKLEIKTSSLRRAIQRGNLANEESKKTEAMSSHAILTEANLASPLEVVEGEAPDYSRRSLHFFDISNPLRLLCAQIESHPWFEKSVVIMVLLSCFVIAFESPDLVAKYGIVFSLFNGLISRQPP